MFVAFVCWYFVNLWRMFLKVFFLGPVVRSQEWWTKNPISNGTCRSVWKPSHMLQGRGVPQYCAMFVFSCYGFIEFPLQKPWRRWHPIHQINTLPETTFESMIFLSLRWDMGVVRFCPDFGLNLGEEGATQFTRELQTKNLRYSKIEVLKIWGVSTSKTGILYRWI